MSKTLRGRKYSEYCGRIGFEKRVYLRDIGEEVIACYYCGDPSTTVDHAFPVSALVSYLDSGRDLPNQCMYLVPACRECNGILSSKVFKNMSDRCRHVKERLKKRYKHVFKAIAWSDEELEELGSGLKAFIVAKEEEHRRLKRRVNY